MGDEIMNKQFNIGDKVYHVGYDLKGVVLADTSNQYSETYKVKFINEYGYESIKDDCSVGLMVRTT
jgi:heat shock protein HspQ